mgnify:CR=1 FL=1
MNDNAIPLIEAILFLSGQPLGKKQLSEMLDMPQSDVEKALKKLDEILNDSIHGIQIRHIDNGYCICTKPELGEYLKEFHTNESRLSDAALEALSIIAYNQPITKLQIDEIRGVNSEKTLQTLTERQLIRESGNLGLPGKPVLYETTDKFLKYFGLNNLKELPEIEQ